MIECLQPHILSKSGAGSAAPPGDYRAALRGSIRLSRCDARRLMGDEYTIYSSARSVKTQSNSPRAARKKLACAAWLLRRRLTFLPSLSMMDWAERLLMRRFSAPREGAAAWSRM